MKHLLLAASLLASGPGLGARAPEAIPVARNLSRPAGSRTLLASVDPGLLSAAPPIEAALPSVLAFPGGIGIPKVITWASTAGDSGIAWGTTSQITAANAYITYNAGGGGMNLFSPGFGIFGESIDSANDTAYFQANTGIGTNLTSVILSVTGGHGSFPAASLTVQTNGILAVGSITLVSGTNPATSAYYINNDGLGDFNMQAGSSGAFQWLANGTLVLRETASALLFYTSGTNIGEINYGNSHFQIFAVDNQEIAILGDVADGAGAVDALITSQVALTATSKALLLIQNNAIDELIVRPTSGIVFKNTATPAAADTGIGSDGSGNMTFNIPTGNDYKFQLNGGNVFDYGAATAGTFTFDGANGIAFNTGTAVASSLYGISEDGTNLTYNAPTGKGHRWTINGTAAMTLSATQWAVTGGEIDTTVGANLTSVVGQADLSHIAGGGVALTVTSSGTACGTPSAASVTGNDLAGSMTITCGSAGTAGNSILAVTFKAAYNTAPHCVISPTSLEAITVAVSAKEIVQTTTTQLAVYCGTGGTCPSSGANTWNYICVQ